MRRHVTGHTGSAGEKQIKKEKIVIQDKVYRKMIQFVTCYQDLGMISCEPFKS